MPKHKIFSAKTSSWRQHHTGHGSEKRPYASEEDATVAAEKATIETGSELGAYCCVQCLQWHIGHARKMRLLSTADFLELELELGRRVAANIKEETLHPYGSIRKRWLTGLKYALRKKAA